MADDLVAGALRSHDRDRYLASLFVPADRRPAVQALYAFNAETARIRDVVSEPMPGEIRLQWWREVVSGARQGEGRDHPVAAALLDAVAEYGLPRAALERLCQARIFDLYDDPMPTLGDLEGYCGETESAVFQLAALILNHGDDADTADAAGHAGVALGIVRLLRLLPLHASRGQCYLPGDLMVAHGLSRDVVAARRPDPALPSLLASMRDIVRDHLGKARANLATAPESVRPAFLPLALVEPYLARLAKAVDPHAPDAGHLPQWRRQWVLWRAAGRAVP